MQNDVSLYEILLEQTSSPLVGLLMMTLAEEVAMLLTALEACA